MRRLLLLPAVAGCLLMASCGGGSGKLSSSDKRDAYEIIEYYNKSLDINKKLFRENEFERALTYMERKGQRSATPSFFPVVNLDTAAMRNPGKAFSAEVRTALTEKYTEYFAAGNQFKSNVEAYKKYLDTEDYKDDNWAKGNALYEENQQLFARMGELVREINGIVSPLADEAELSTLDENPLKDYIIASKGIFDAMNSIMMDIAEEKVSEEDLDTHTADLEQKVENARQLAPVADYESEMDKYGKFLDKIDDFTGELRKIRRNKRYTERDYDSLDKKYDNVIDAYNRFVS